MKFSGCWLKSGCRTLTAALVVVVGTGLVASSPGRAVVIDGIDDDFGVFWLLQAGQAANGGGTTTSIDLTAVGSFDVTSFSASSVTLQIMIANTTVLSGAVTEAGITAFGLGVNPDATAVSFSDDNDGAFTDAIVKSDPNQIFPGGFRHIDVCGFAQGCNGGSQGGALAVGASDSFILTIFGDFSGGYVVLEPFPIKFQTTEDSFSFSGKVPEPSSLLIFGVGLLGLGFLARRRNPVAGRRHPERR